MGTIGASTYILFSYHHCLTQIVQDKIAAQHPELEGSMFVPVVQGSDKTTVTVGTGQNEYYPLYASIGNAKNHLRRAHKGAVTVIGFLSIPKSKS